jgi:Flp pilus assembly protein TadG
MRRRTQGFIGNESGAIALVMALALVALLGMAALVVDYGYMAVVQDELKKAAEAGALAGALALPPASNPNWSAGQSAAENIVTENYAAGQQLTDAQVEGGYWNLSSKSFDADTNKTPSSSEVAAIRVVVAKSVQLSFAPILPGINSTKNLSGTAVAMVKPTTSVTGGWGILEIGNGDVSISGAVANKGSVGVNGNGKVTVSGSGSIDGNLYVNGNGNVTLSGSTHVDGSVWDQGSGKFTMSGSAAVKGVAYLDDAVTQSYGWSTSINGHDYQGGSGFQPGDISSNASGASAAQTAAQGANTAYNNFSALTATVGPSKVNSSHAPVSITGSTATNSVNVVDLTRLTLGGDASLTLTAPADGYFVIKVSGNFSISGSAEVKLAGGIPYEHVTFVNTGTKTATLEGSAKIKGNILSPNGAISLSGNAEYYGSLVGGKNITLSGSVHSPVQIPWLTSPSGSSSAARAYLVQ